MARQRALRGAFLVGAAWLVWPAGPARGGPSEWDRLPANLDVPPAVAAEELGPRIPLPPRPAEPPAVPQSSAPRSCGGGLCLTLGPPPPPPQRVPAAPVVGVLDWSTPTAPTAAHQLLISVSRERSEAAPQP